MPTYVYEYDDTGERQDVFQRMSDEPITEIDGRSVTRVPCVGLAPMVEDFTAYVSNALPHTIEGCKKVKQNGRYKPLIDSRKTEREIIARYDLTRDAAQNELD